jgi:1-pyrroline dehydrogenase
MVKEPAVSSSLNNEELNGLVQRTIASGTFIDGQWVGSAGSDGDRGIATINPATGRLIGHLPETTLNELDVAVAAARAATTLWARLTPRERSEYLIALADRLLDDIENLAALEALNSGHPISTVAGEVKSGADRLKFFAGAGRLLEGRSAGEYAKGYTSIIRREPIGVAGLITPWNYPLLTALTKLSPALAAGNTVILKPSEQTPLTTLRLAELAREILPPGVLNVVTGRGETLGAAMAAHAGIDIISLTGGTATGKVVARIAAESLKQVHLELGGKAPAIVLKDADPQEVAEALKWASFWNAGQDCSAAVRVIVSQEIYEPVMEALVATVSAMKVGDPLDPDIEMGPLTFEGHRDRVEGYLNRAIDSGAKVILGGNRVGSQGYFLEPTILTNAAQDSEIVQQEVFGPVVTIQSAADDWEAIRLANDVEYGLGASIFTKDVGVAFEAARQLEFGTVWINDHGAVTAEMPWGGYKKSGYGKERSVYSLEEFTQIKHIMLRLPQHD